MSAPARTETPVLAAAIGAGILVCYPASLPVGTSYAGLAPALFAVPLAAALLWLKHLHWFGAAYLVIVVAVGFFAAIYASMFSSGALGVSLCLFSCSAEEVAANVWKAQVVGAVGGLVGALVPFLALTPLGPAMRDRTALAVAAISLPALALLGSIGFSQTLPGLNLKLVDAEAPNARLFQMMLFIIPWQLAFGAALAYMLRRHTPALKARSSSPLPAA